MQTLIKRKVNLQNSGWQHSGHPSRLSAELRTRNGCLWSFSFSEKKKKKKLQKPLKFLHFHSAGTDMSALTLFESAAKHAILNCSKFNSITISQGPNCICTTFGLFPLCKLFCSSTDTHYRNVLPKPKRMKNVPNKKNAILNIGNEIIDKNIHLLRHVLSNSIKKYLYDW